MLGKLLKQEIRTQGKTIAGTYGILAVATILMIVCYLVSRMADDSIFETVFMFSFAIYALTIIVVVVVDFIYLCFQFYKSMYSEQGYLTHTLPVKTTQVLHVKVVVSFGYLFLTGILSILSFIVIGMTVDGMRLETMIQAVGQAIQTISHDIGISAVTFVCFALFVFMIGCLNALLLFFAGTSIGQLFHRSKVACGIAASIALYYCSQIFSLILVVIGGLLYTKISVMQGAAAPKWLMAGGSLLALCLTIIYYVICRVIVQKHLNLE